MPAGKTCQRDANAAEKEYYPYIKKFFGRAAPLYNATELFFSKIRDKAVDIAGAEKGARVLDAATGTGKQAFAFAKRGYDVIGIDISKGMIRIAGRDNKYGNARFAIADAANMPFRENRFDISSMSFALHDMPLSVRKKALDEMARVTKPGGTIMIVEHGSHRNRILGYLIHAFLKTFDTKYYAEFFKADFEETARKSGIRIIKETPALGGAVRIFKGANLKKSHEPGKNPAEIPCHKAQRKGSHPDGRA